MKIYYDLDLNSFEAWSGAVDTLNRIQNEDKISEFETILEEMYPDGMDEGELNDLLWFESDTVFGWLGIRTEQEIRDELKEAEGELEDLMDEFEGEVDEINANRELEGLNEMDDEEKAALFNENYKDDADEIKERIGELEEELAMI